MAGITKSFGDSFGDSLRVEKLRKRVGSGKKSFQFEASFEIAATERVALVGPSGVGKTTLLRLIAGLEPLSAKGDSGRIRLGGRDITELAVQKREIGFVFQEQALFGGRSVFENVAFGLRMRGIAAPEIKERVSEWLAKLGLSGHADENVDPLSGGERQRVALARALVVRPQLILMDEPFTGLDAGLKDSLCAEVLRIHSEKPVPLLLVTHDEREVSRLATRTILFEEFAGATGMVRGTIGAPFSIEH